MITVRYKCESCRAWVFDWREVVLGGEMFEVCQPCAAIVDGPPRELPLGRPRVAVSDVADVCPTCISGNGVCERIKEL